MNSGIRWANKWIHFVCVCVCASLKYRFYLEACTHAGANTCSKREFVKWLHSLVMFFHLFFGCIYSDSIPPLFHHKKNMCNLQFLFRNSVLESFLSMCWITLEPSTWIFWIEIDNFTFTCFILFGTEIRDKKKQQQHKKPYEYVCVSNTIREHRV